jgi:two-component system chemotaxis response regulator CheB
MTPRIRVLVVDDSALVRRALTDGLARFPEIEVVGTAVDPYVARDRILQLNPDVLTLDIEMPRMDGITFLKLLMRHRPMPVIVMSSLTAGGSQKALEALRAGAVEVLEKPSGSMSVVEDSFRLAEVIKAAAKARIRTPSQEDEAPASGTPPVVAPMAPGSPAPPVAPSQTPAQRQYVRVPESQRPARQPVVVARRYDPRKIILMGASTGGTEALREVLVSLSGDTPGICIVQHIPAHFSTAFAQRLNDLCQLEVREARSGDRVQAGLALVAPGGFHMMLLWRGGGYEVVLNEGPKIHYQRPSVDVLFNSAVKAGAAPHSLALLLTGMGSDGATGMLELQNGGSQTVAQDENTCVVFGMPREAIRLGAAQQVLPLQQMAGRIERFAAECAMKMA